MKEFQTVEGKFMCTGGSWGHTECALCLLGRMHCLETFIPRSRCCLTVSGHDFFDIYLYI